MKLFTKYFFKRLLYASMSKERKTISWSFTHVYRGVVPRGWG